MTIEFRAGEGGATFVVGSSEQVAALIASGTAAVDALVTEAEAARDSAQGHAQAAADAAAALVIPTVDTLPLEPFDGQRLVWDPTGELASYETAAQLWVRGDGTPLAVLHDDFDGDADTMLDERLVEFTRDPVRASPGEPGTFNRHGLTPGIKIDGNGRAALNTIDNSTMGNMSLVSAKCVEREFMFGLLPSTGGAGGHSGIIVVGDGWKALRFQVGLDRVMRLRVIDAIAATTTEVDTATIASWTATTVQRFWCRYSFDDGLGEYVCTVKHLGPLGGPNVASPTEVSYTVTDVDPAPLAGIWLSGTNPRVDYFSIYPLDSNAGVDLGEGLIFEGLRTIGRVEGADGVWVQDLTGNGLLDVLFAASANSNGIPAGVYLFEQYAPGKFYKHTIDENADGSTSDRFFKIEGVCVWDIGDGVPMIVVVNQRMPGQIWGYRPVNPAKMSGAWTRVLLASLEHGQDCFVEDIDGDGHDELVVLYQGTGPGDGGIAWFDWTFGADPLAPGSYSIYPIVEDLPGPWSALKRIKFVWAGGKQALIFSKRDNSRQPNATPGIAAAIRPAVVTDPWTVVDLFVAADARDLCWIDAGDFSGNGNGLDIVYGVQGETPIRYLEFPAAAADPFDVSVLPWTSVQLADPGGTRTIWNVMTIRVNGMTRDALVTCQNEYGVVAYVYLSGAWEEKKLIRFTYDHPSDNPNVPLLDLYGDGKLYQVHADSGGNRGMVLTFRGDEG